MKQHKPRLSFVPNRGGALSWREGPSLKKCAAVIRFQIDQDLHLCRLLAPDEPEAAYGLQAVWRWQQEPSGYRLWVEVENQGQVPVTLESIDVLTTPELDMRVPPAQWSVYQNGWASWSPSFARHLTDSLYTDPDTLIYRITHQPHWGPEDRERIGSEWVTVVTNLKTKDPTPKALLAGFVTTKEQLSEIRIGESSLSARCYLDGIPLAPGQSVRSEVLLVQVGPDPLALLETWAEVTGQEMQARIPSQSPTGWCTWYYFYGENTAGDVLENLEAITQHSLPLDVILLDDGYQTAIGDWLSIDVTKFPQGIEPVAQAVRETGHSLGIWTAPFGAAKDSQLFAEHPDWFLQDEGEPVLGWTHWGTDCYALDCTHPQVLDWLRTTFGRMRKEWGVQFFKIDFVFAAGHPGRHHDPTATRAQALRQGVSVIREAIGDDAFLLGCGAPMGPCIGLVDGMRVGPDVDPNWHPIWRHDLSMPSTENALRNSIARTPFHGRLWANDPDCLLVRQRGTDLDLVLNEMRTLTALTALLGGLTLNSDHLPEIRPGRLKYLRQALPPTGISARPLDLFEHELPRRLLLPLKQDWGQWWIAGVINWEDRTTETTVRLEDLGLPPARYHVYHYWRRRYLGVTEDAVAIPRHQPHETAVLLFKPVVNHPDLLTTTFHVCQGAVEVEYCRGQIAPSQEQERKTEEWVLSLGLYKQGQQFGEVLFTVPEKWQALEGRVNGIKRPLVEIAPGVVSLGITLDGRAEVEMRFERKTK